MSDNPVRALVWDEAPRHAPKAMYPKSLNGAIADGLNELGEGRIVATTANLDEPDQGITDEALANADVLLWWGHARHDEVSDETASKVIKAGLTRSSPAAPAAARGRARARAASSTSGPATKSSRLITTRTSAASSTTPCCGRRGASDDAAVETGHHRGGVFGGR